MERDRHCDSVSIATMGSMSIITARRAAFNNQHHEGGSGWTTSLELPTDLLLFKSTPTARLFLRPSTIYLLFNQSAELPNMAHEAPAASPTGPNVTTTHQDSLYPNQPGWLICTYVQTLPSQNPQLLPAGGAVESGVVPPVGEPILEPRSVQMPPLLSYHIQAMLQILRQEDSVLRRHCEQPVVSAANGSTPKPRPDRQAVARDAFQSDPHIGARTASLKGFEHTFTCDEVVCYHSECQIHAAAEDDRSKRCSEEYQPQYGKPGSSLSEVGHIPSWDAFCEPQRPLQSGKEFATLRSDMPGQGPRRPAQPPIDHWAWFSQDVVEASIKDSGIEEGPGQQTPASMMLVPGCDLGSSPYESELSGFGLPHLDGGDDGVFDWTETHPKYLDDPVLPPWSFEGQSPVGLASLQFEDVKAVQSLDLEPCMSKTDITDQLDPCHTFSPQRDKKETQSDTYNCAISGTLASLDKASLVPNAKTHPSEGVIGAEDRPTATESTSQTCQRTSQTRNRPTTASSQRGPNSPLQRNPSTTRQSSNNQGGHPTKVRPGRAPDRQFDKSNTVPRHRDVSHSKRKLSNDCWARRDSGPVGPDELAERKEDARLTYDILHVPPLGENGTQSASPGPRTRIGGHEGETIAVNSALKSTKEEVKRHTRVSSGKRQRIVEDISNAHASKRPHSSSLDQITGGNSKMLHCFEPKGGLPEHAGRTTHPEENPPSKRVKFAPP